MRKLGSLCVATLLALLCALPSLGGSAPAFVLESNSGGVYDYSLVVPGGTAFDIQSGQTMVLSGLSGVTGAAISGVLEDSLCGGFGLTLSGFTASSVTLTNSSSDQCFYGPGGTDANLEIDSSVTTLGTVNYAIENPPGGFYTGTTEGPVAPEPGAGALLLTGIAALGAGYRLRLRRVPG
jgi:hypothetical protein